MAIGRPLEFDPDTALEAAMQLFWRRGYESSSLQELLSAMGLSKSSFYQTFKSKHALFQRCIQHYRSMMTNLLSSSLNEIGSGKAFITTLFRDVGNETSGSDARRGCLIMNTASEVAQSDAEIAKLVSHGLDSIAEVFEQAITQGQKEGDIPDDKDAKILAKYLVSSMSGLKNMVKAGASRKTINQITDTVLLVLD